MRPSIAPMAALIPSAYALALEATAVSAAGPHANGCHAVLPMLGARSKNVCRRKRSRKPVASTKACGVGEPMHIQHQQ